MKKIHPLAAGRAALLALMLAGASTMASAQGAGQGAQTLEQLEQQAAQAIGAGRWDAALSAMEAMQALDVRLPESFAYYYAQALSRQGRHVEARRVLTAYLSSAGADARFAEPARRLLQEIEAPAAEQQARLEQAEGVQRSARLIRSSVAGLGGAVRSVAFTLEGDRVLAAVGPRVALLDIDKRAVVGSVQAAAAVQDVQAHPLGHGWTAAHGKGVDLWRSTTAPPVPGLSDAKPARAAAIHPEGVEMSFALNSGMVRRVDMRTRLWSDWANLGKVPVERLAYSPDGRWLAAATGRPAVVHVGATGSGAGEKAMKLALGTATVDAMAFTPDARRLIVADAAGRRLLAWAGGNDAKPWSVFVSDVDITPGTLAMDPRGRMLATAHGARIELRDLAKGALLARLHLPAGAKVTATAFDFGGERFATGLADGTVHVWDLSGY